MIKTNFWLFILLSTIITYGQQSPEVFIKKVIALKTKNDPKNFELTSYNKVIVTADPNSSIGYIDTIFKIKKGIKSIKSLDSSDYKFKKIVSKQHLYQTEKISSLSKTDNYLKEQIISTKMAGFKEPIYEYFALELSPFSLYQKKIKITEKEYINPISEKGLKEYYFAFEKKTIIDSRKITIISFTPKINRKHTNLSGSLYIDEEKLSIAKAILKTSGKLKITSLHEMSWNEDINNWFPSKIKLSIKKGDNKYPIKILGETISFDEIDFKYNPLDKKYASDFIEILSTTKFSQISFGNQIIQNKQFSIEVPEKAINRKEELWYNYFNDTTDVRSKTTYVSLDSLIEAKRIENKIKIGRKIIKGYYPIGFFDFDLRYLARYNNYEGFRLGVGGITNEKLFKHFKTEGYFAYGIKDGTFKGSLTSSISINKASETWFGIGYKDDLSEIANTALEIDKRTFKIYDPRPFNINTFYNHESWRGFIESKVIPKTEAILQISQSNIQPRFNYFYNLNNTVYSSFNTSLLTFSLQWNPFSKYMQTPNGRIEYNKNYPKFTFQISKTINNLMENDFDFGKIDFRFEYQKKFNSNQKISLLIEAGKAFGEVPLTHLYNHSPNNLNKDKIIQRITFAGRDSFETMYFNEFFSDKYAYIHLKHYFPKWQISRQIKPVLCLVSRYGIGDLEHKERHSEILFKKLEKGFYESGFELNQIYKGLGFTAFYRYGPNQLPSFEDNIAIKLSLQINLGFNN
jgi:hypothetical protein